MTLDKSLMSILFKVSGIRHPYVENDEHYRTVVLCKQPSPILWGSWGPNLPVIRLLFSLSVALLVVIRKRLSGHLDRSRWF